MRKEEKISDTVAPVKRHSFLDSINKSLSFTWLMDQLQVSDEKHRIRRTALFGGVAWVILSIILCIIAKFLIPNHPLVNKYRLPTDLIKSSCAICGLFDLSPFSYSWLQLKLQLSWDQVKRNSPLHHPPRFCCPVIVTVGDEESSEFHVQTEAYVNVLKQQDHSIDYLNVEGKSHFTILVEFLGKGGKLFRQILSNITGELK